jgi:uncharacterized repeat protein (TIGR02543 family)
MKKLITVISIFLFLICVIASADNYFNNLHVDKHGYIVAGGPEVMPHMRNSRCPYCHYDFDTGTSVTLTMTCNPGYHFVGWTGGGCESVGSNPVCTVTMDASKDVTAVCQ